MPFVTVYYGPYLNHGIINHRLPKINGLTSALKRLGYDTHIIPINNYNRLSIEMCNRVIFQCDIRNLMFNMQMEDDPVCQRAVSAVQEARERMFVFDKESAFSSSIHNGWTDVQNSKPHFDNMASPPSRTNAEDVHLMSSIRPSSSEMLEVVEHRASKVKIVCNKESPHLVQKLSVIQEASEETD